jgi:hypothetical protein
LTQRNANGKIRLPSVSNKLLKEGRMDRDTIKDALINLLAEIQSDSGYPSVEVTGRTCPLEDLEGFDSLIWPISIRLLVKVIGVEIPRKTNIYVSKGKKLMVDEIVEVVHQVVTVQGRKT